MTLIYNKKFYESRRRELRRNMTGPGQFSIGRYIVDFYASRIRLAIEIDGDTHYDPEAIKKDQVRDRNLANKGIKVLRFTNLDVTRNIEGVLDAIYQEVFSRPPLHLPLTKGEKERG